MSSEFLNFTGNVFKLPVNRRAKEASDKLILLERLWLLEQQGEVTEETRTLYEKCRKFLIENLPKEDIETKIKASMNFEIKTANSIIPDFDGDPSKTRDFLDCVKYYYDTLSQDGKASLLLYLTKVKLRGTAKTATLGATSSLTALTKAIKDRFQPKITTASIQRKLAALQQSDKSVEKFASEIEALISQLSELQIEENGEASRKLVTTLNDTLALNTLKMGANAELKKVLLASTAKTFTEAVETALNAESGLATFEGTSAQVNYINKKQWTRRGYRRRQFYRGGYNQSNQSQSKEDSSNSYQAHSNQRGQNSQNNHRGGNKGYRGRGAKNGQRPPKDRTNVSIAAASEEVPLTP